MVYFFVKASEIYEDLAIIILLLTFLLCAFFDRPIPEAIKNVKTDADWYQVYGFINIFIVLIWVGRILDHAIFILSDYPSMEALAVILAISMTLYSLFLIRITYKLLSLKPGALEETKMILVATPAVHVGLISLALFMANYLTCNNMDTPDHQYIYLEDQLVSSLMVYWPWLLYFFLSKKVNALWRAINNHNNSTAEPAT